MQEKNKQKNKTLEEVFSAGLANLNFEVAKADIKNTNYSVGEIRNLTSDIMDKVSKENNVRLMLAIAKSVNSWKNDKTLVWKRSLINYAYSHEEVDAIYTGRNVSGSEFVVVVDSVIDDSILEHNDFCFEILEKYEDIDNFMVLDNEEFFSMRDEYVEYSKIYQRG